jgi:hypothetical protein
LAFIESIRRLRSSGDNATAAAIASAISSVEYGFTMKASPSSRLAPVNFERMSDPRSAL